MTHPVYRIRSMARDEVDLAVDWAAQEGWNSGLYDANCYYSADPNGFLIGLLDDEPIACISAVRYDSTFGFIGFYIVKPEYRGQRYGIQIWNAAMEYLKGCNIALDGVVEQQANYQKSGFNLAYRNIRYEGRVPETSAPNTDGMALAAACIDLNRIPFDDVEAYNDRFFPTQRTRFLKQWISQPDSHAYGIQKDNKLIACGVIRACQTGYKIGPLLAESEQLAGSLLTALIGQIQPGSLFYLDVPEINTSAVALAERYHMQVSFETARMYTGEQPTLPISVLYGVTSFEIG